MGAAASLHPESTPLLSRPRTNSSRTIDCTDNSQTNVPIVLVLFFDTTALLKDLNMHFDNVHSIPNYFAFQGKTWIFVECNSIKAAVGKFRNYELTWNDFMKRIKVVCRYDEAIGDFDFQHWFRKSNTILIKMNIYFSHWLVMNTTKPMYHVYELNSCFHGFLSVVIHWHSMDSFSLQKFPFLSGFYSTKAKE
jgi:hypothetical protein